MARVLIAGCGYVGAALAEELVADGHQVFALRRSAAPLPPGVEPIRADVLDRAALAAIPRDFDKAVYAVAAESADERAYRAAYVDGLEEVTNALERGSPRLTRLIFTSSTSVYAQADGEWVDEASPTQPTRFSGRILLEGEQLLRSSPLPSTVLRLGGIYGPGRTRLVESVSSGRARCRDGAPHFTNRIQRDDAAGAIRHLMFASNPPDLVLGVDGAPADECDVLCWLAERIGAPSPAAAPPNGDSQAGKSMRRAGSKRCRNARLLASGYEFRVPDYRVGYATYVAKEG
jgi:nucleoside-diphosphate-sugar epimerase